MANAVRVSLKQWSWPFVAMRQRVIWLLLFVGLLSVVGLWWAGMFMQAISSSAAITVQGIALPTRDTIVVDIVNSSSTAATIAQVQVDSAYWSFAAEPSADLMPSEKATLTVPYLWVEGEPHVITIVTDSGATIEGRIEVAQLD